MANEIKVTPRLLLTNGSLKRDINPGTISIDQTAGVAYHNTHEIGTSEESVSTFGDITTEGWLYMRNLDTVNYVQWGFATGVYGGRMEAGEVALFRSEPSLTLYLKANTATCFVDVLMLED